MAFTLSGSKQEMDEIMRRKKEECTNDGTLDRHGHPAMRQRTGTWTAGFLILVNQGLATLAFFGVGVNLVVFLTRVMGDDNAIAANKVSKWTGTVYIFSLLGAFLSDSYWGRYLTCAIFQLIFVFGLALLSLCTHTFLLNPSGCGSEISPCKPHTTLVKALFYVSIYLVALGNGGYQPNIATFGADQFDQNSTSESNSKVTFFSFFYLALNLGSLFSDTILVYFEDRGRWTLGFWAATISSFAALVLFLAGTPRYRHLRANGNPISRICQVLVVAAKRWNMSSSREDDDDMFYYEVGHDGNDHFINGGSGRKLLHTQGFKFLDRAAVITKGEASNMSKKSNTNPWSVCTLTQVEEVKCVLRLLPIWLCTILYSVVFTQMASLFVEQGAAMRTSVSGFHIPPASMSSSDIITVAFFIYAHHHIIDPIFARFRKTTKGRLTELERMGIGLIIAMVGMIVAGIVERFRQKYEIPGKGSSSLSILWQIPQYACIGASEVFMYVGQLEFFNDQAPDGLKSFGSALCMMSISVGNYVSILIVTTVMKFSSGNEMAGWIPARNLNQGHLDRFFFLLAAFTTVDFAVYIVTARWYKCTKFEAKEDTIPDENLDFV